MQKFVCCINFVCIDQRQIGFCYCYTGKRLLSILLVRPGALLALATDFFLRVTEIRYVAPLLLPLLLVPAPMFFCCRKVANDSANVVF